MKKLLATFCLLGVSASASAITWTDWKSGPVRLSEDGKYGKKSYSNVFNINKAGYDSSVHEITGIKLDFWFADDYRDYRTGVDIDYKKYTKYGWNIVIRELEEVDIFVGSNKVNGVFDVVLDEEVNGYHPYPTYDHLGSYDVTGLGGGAILDDMKNGYLRFKVAINDNYDSGWDVDHQTKTKTYTKKEDTYFKKAKLTVYGREIQVPDGGQTFVLLGVALFGIAGLRRKLSV